MAKHAHEIEAACDVRWTARVTKEGLVMVKDLASGEEFQATAYTVDTDAVRFALPGDNGLRVLASSAPGYAGFVKALSKSPAVGEAPVSPFPTATRAAGASTGDK